MKTIGFPISDMENEFRRVLLPKDIKNINNPQYLIFEKSYGEVLGIKDEEYISAGAKISNRDEVLSQDIICDPKVGNAEYLISLKEEQIVFGWIHATQNKIITDKLLAAKASAYAWEKMYECGRHVFWKNNELAGEAAIMHAFQCYGELPHGCNIAVIGRGNTARGAIKILNMLGANVVQYDRNTEKLLRTEIGEYDAIVNCVLWDVFRSDHIIYKDDLLKMKKNSIIIDISCDKNGGIETSRPTTICNPLYIVDGIYHYAVDHTPSIYHRTFTKDISGFIWKYINELISENCSNTLKTALIIKNGEILDEEIIAYQNR